MVRTRKFGGKKYYYADMRYAKLDMIDRKERLQLKGYLVRITSQKCVLAGMGIKYIIWKRKK